MLKTTNRPEGLPRDLGEVPDPTPLARTVGFQRPPTLREQMQQAIREHLSFQAASQGFETFEEADDFYVQDDVEPTSRHELDDDLPPWNEAEQQAQARQFAQDYVDPSKAKGKSGEDNPQAGGGAKPPDQQPGAAP